MPFVGIPPNYYLCYPGTTNAIPKGLWGVSSVGSERMLDRHEVTGSIPVHPTNRKAYSLKKKCLRLFNCETDDISVV